MYRNKFFEGQKHDLSELKDIVRILRDPDEGCAWDSVQTHETLKKNLTDECEEVIEAIDNKDFDNLCEELGDVLLQVVLHSEIAAEEGKFTLDDVIQGLADKLIRRHPHIFGDEPRPTNPDEAHAMWTRVKKAEKQRKYAFYGHDVCGVIKAKASSCPEIETPLDLYGFLCNEWCSDTCAPRMRSEWSPQNRTLGQCSITAFLAQDIFGGDVYGTITDNGNIHCFNVVDGIRFDLTSEQFGERAKFIDYEKGELQDRNSPDHFQKAEKLERYRYLKGRLDALS